MMSQESNKIGNTIALNEGLDSKETLRQTKSGKDLLTDQTLMNTISAMNLLEEAVE